MSKLKFLILSILCLLVLIGPSIYGGTPEKINVLLKTGYETAGIKQFVDRFEQETGIQVNYDVVDEATLRKRTLLEASVKSPAYDVIAVQFWNFPEVFQSGILEPLDKWMEKDLYPTFDVENIPEQLRNLYKEEGTLYVVPHGGAGGALAYRTDILEKWGFKKPQTTKDVMKLAKALSVLEPDLYPAIGRGDATFASFGSTVGWAWGYGARILDENNQVTINTPEMLEAMEDWVTLLREYGPPGQGSIGWQQMSEIYRKGKVVLNFDMTGFPAVYDNPELSKVANKVGLSLIKGPAGNYCQWLYSEGLAINKYSKKKEAAAKFIQWRSSLETYKLEVKNGLRLDIPYNPIFETEIFKEKSKGKEFWTEKLDDIFAAIDYRYWPFVPEFSEVAVAFQEEISAAIAGTQSVEKALENAQSKVEKIMREAGY